MKKAVVLLSGGIDSATALAWAARNGFSCHALTVAYGQRHAVEINAARKVAASLGAAEHRVMNLDLRALGGSALTADVPLPVDRREDEMVAGGIPDSYVPGRNTIFLSLALAYAEVIGAFDLFIGVNAGDRAGYPDCRPEFIAAFQAAANLGTRAGVEGGRFTIHTPLAAMSKAEIIGRGRLLGIDYDLTHSCYDPDIVGAACGRCDACRLRVAGFAGAGGSL